MTAVHNCWRLQSAVSFALFSRHTHPVGQYGGSQTIKCLRCVVIIQAANKAKCNVVCGKWQHSDSLLCSKCHFYFALPFIRYLLSLVNPCNRLFRNRPLFCHYKITWFWGRGLGRRQKNLWTQSAHWLLLGFIYNALIWVMFSKETWIPKADCFPVLFCKHICKLFVQYKYI